MSQVSSPVPEKKKHHLELSSGKVEVDYDHDSNDDDHEEEADNGTDENIKKTDEKAELASVGARRRSPSPSASSRSRSPDSNRRKIPTKFYFYGLDEMHEDDLKKPDHESEKKKKSFFYTVDEYGHVTEVETLPERPESPEKAGTSVAATSASPLIHRRSDDTRKSKSILDRNDHYPKSSSSSRLAFGSEAANREKSPSSRSSVKPFGTASSSPADKALIYGRATQETSSSRMGSNMKVRQNRQQQQQTKSSIFGVVGTRGTSPPSATKGIKHMIPVRSQKKQSSPDVSPSRPLQSSVKCNLTAALLKSGNSPTAAQLYPVRTRSSTTTRTSAGSKSNLPASTQKIQVSVIHSSH